MSALNIRNIDHTLLKQVKVTAAMNGMPMREWIVRVLEKAVANGGRVEGGTDTKTQRAGATTEKRPGATEEKGSVNPNVPSGRVVKVKGPNFNGPRPGVTSIAYDLCLQCRQPLKNANGKAMCDNDECSNHSTFPMLPGRHYPEVQH